MLSRDQIKAHVLQDLAKQFKRPTSDFKEGDDLRVRWSFDDRSLREWGKELNNASWFSGEIAPSEIIACQTIKGVIDLIFKAQGRKKPRPSPSGQSNSSGG